MTQEQEAITIVNVDRLQEGLIVLFSDGTSTLFHTNFLYEMREHDGNRVLPRETLHEMPGPR